MGFFLFDAISRAMRGRRRTQRLEAAAAWPSITAKLLKGSVVSKDELAEGSAAQLDQVEFPYYFVLDNGYFGGHLRTMPCSDSEGRRLIDKVEEGAPVVARYDPANPDRTAALASDNEELAFKIWSS